MVSLPVLKKRTVQNGMVIETTSHEVKQTLTQRAHLLSDFHECFFMKEWQKKIAVEGINAGFINQEEYEKFSFPQRNAEPGVNYP